MVEFNLGTTPKKVGFDGLCKATADITPPPPSLSNFL
jgi:hypothetical protein